MYGSLNVQFDLMLYLITVVCPRAAHLAVKFMLAYLMSSIVLFLLLIVIVVLELLYIFSFLENSISQIVW